MALTLEGIKRRAKKMKREIPITHTQALERIAREEGYENYWEAVKALGHKE